MQLLTETHDYLFKEIADPRVHDWPLMSSPWKILVIISVYLYAIYIFIPSYMANRKPYVLKQVLNIYNIFEIITNLIIVYGIMTSGWTTTYKLFCPLVDYSEDKMSLRMANYVWWLFLLKIVDFLETVFFALRKKSNQVSILHVYHHISTVIVLWITTKYFAGGLITITAIVNCSVHVLMYTYYFLSSFGPEMQKKLNIVKSKLTFIQMVQMVVIILYVSQALLPNCHYTKWAAYITVPYVFINLLCFINFYKKSYSKKKNA